MRLLVTLVNYQPVRTPLNITCTINCICLLLMLNEDVQCSRVLQVPHCPLSADVCDFAHVLVSPAPRFKVDDICQFYKVRILCEWITMQVCTCGYVSILDVFAGPY